MAVSAPLTTAASRSCCARPTSRCTRPSAAASGRAGALRAATRARDGDAGRAAWFARDDEQREEIRACSTTRTRSTIVFQPIMDLRTGRIAGYESLSRFNREPARAPDEWFAQAHRCGLGYALEAKAIAARARHARPPGRHLPDRQPLPSSLRRRGGAARAARARSTASSIEVTENELVSDDPAIAVALAGLRERGARLAVDDIGAGYAGLTHVMRLAAGHHQARPRADDRRRRATRSRPRWSARSCATRATSTPTVVRRGRRDARRARPPRRPRRRLRAGLRDRAPAAAVGRRWRREAAAACLHVLRGHPGRRRRHAGARRARPPPRGCSRSGSRARRPRRT